MHTVKIADGQHDPGKPGGLHVVKNFHFRKNPSKTER